MLRFRDRYFDALADAPADLMSMQHIPQERMKEIGRWSNDVQDFGLTCCLHLHHLKDWAHYDQAVPLHKAAIEGHINDSRSLRIVADICNGTKHAVLERGSRSDVTDPAGVVRSTSLQSTRDSSGALVVTASHVVTSSSGSTPLIDIIDDSIREWEALMRTIGVIK